MAQKHKESFLRVALVLWPHILPLFEPMPTLFRSNLLCMNDPAPSFLCPKPVDIVLSVLECPWVRACRGLELLPRGTSPAPNTHSVVTTVSL